MACCVCDVVMNHESPRNASATRGWTSQPRHSVGGSVVRLLSNPRALRHDNNTPWDLSATRSTQLSHVSWFSCTARVFCARSRPPSACLCFCWPLIHPDPPTAPPPTPPCRSPAQREWWMGVCVRVRFVAVCCYSFVSIRQVVCRSAGGHGRGSNVRRAHGLKFRFESTCQPPSPRRPTPSPADLAV